MEVPIPQHCRSTSASASRWFVIFARLITPTRPYLDGLLRRGGETGAAKCDSHPDTREALETSGRSLWAEQRANADTMAVGVLIALSPSWLDSTRYSAALCLQHR